MIGRILIWRKIAKSPDSILAKISTHTGIYNEQHSKIQLLELTCPFNTTGHLQAAYECKSSKCKYQLLISELDRLGHSTLYSTIEIGCS